MFENKTVIGPHNSYLDLATKTFVVTQQPSRQVAGQASQWLPLYQSQPLCTVLRIRVVSFFVSSISLFSPGSTCQSVELVRVSFRHPFHGTLHLEQGYGRSPDTGFARTLVVAVVKSPGMGTNKRRGQRRMVMISVCPSCNVHRASSVLS